MKCQLCGSGKYQEKYKLKSIWPLQTEYFSLLICENCGFMWIKPLPDLEAVLPFYENLNEEQLSNISLYRNYIMRDIQRALTNIEDIKKAKGKLLDIGCGFGLFLKEARDRGWDVMGMDASPKIAEYVQGTYGIKVLNNLDSVKEQSQDVVIMSQLIEHLPQPDDLLNDVKRILKDDGLLYIITPNCDSLLAYIKKERFNYWIPPEHCVYYNPRTLDLVVRKSGFRPCKIDSSYSFDIADLLKYFFRIPFRCAQVIELFLKPFIERLIPLKGSQVEIYCFKT